ncbi:MaoC family dehydratase N-terminal domain-containing protein [Peribacillus psychrosaccharolyticus]|uniref:MaoC family dehydratase N-terminal domain-containing protein n=1 Tax=Peribacillus psychrosaccharolyticus TaxID=1407 RepID=A0A974S1D6_PERPY|nr:MaoC/PaaZ C-terminal domain-containing protein [Peribacillus psychrosaccharolyticus]MEC2053907.1 MaoC/PaaZ C-terminal domain-containing protein [Peribacillus psychrosaccharolyticus]MED3742479.1 MaoC/PaaZ C-terminal domain-containing protein [Peribacillus psychrosaccharolyticus]QQT01436.1 MaoC family dehydratase N-terminal domain-containing protein [Peribacillus psychrosaccharolyticus]
MAHYYEDFSIGDEFTSPGRTVTESDVSVFAGLSGDYNPLHTDEEFAKETIFGTRIAHGLLGLSMVSGLVMRLGVFDGTVIAFLGLDWKFIGPLFIGDTIHFEMKIIEKRETSKADRGIIVREVLLFNQKNEVVQKGTMTIMMKRKSEKLVE